MSTRTRGTKADTILIGEAAGRLLRALPGGLYPTLRHKRALEAYLYEHIFEALDVVRLPAESIDRTDKEAFNETAEALAEDFLEQKAPSLGWFTGGTSTKREHEAKWIAQLNSALRDLVKMYLKLKRTRTGWESGMMEVLMENVTAGADEAGEQGNADGQPGGKPDASSADVDDEGGLHMSENEEHGQPGASGTSKLVADDKHHD